MSSTNLSSETESAQQPAGPAGNPVIDLFRLALNPKGAGASPTAAWISRHPVLSLITLAYGITWLGLIPLIRNPGLASQADWSHASDPAILAYAFLGVLGCLWAALIVAGATGGRAGRMALLRGYLRWRVGLQWYLAVVLFPIAVFVLAAMLSNGPGSALQVALTPILSATFISSFGFWLARYLVGNFEEICWRASLLPRLQGRYSALVASLLVGLVQGFWHLPFAFVRGHYVQVIGLPAMVLQSVAMSIVFTWVYNNTRGSLLLVAVFHAAYDALSQLQAADARLLYINIGVWCLAAVIVIAGFGWRHLSRKSDTELSYAILPAGQ